MRPDQAEAEADSGKPEDILLVTAGGAGAGWSAFIPAWAPKNNSRAVTKRVAV